MHVYELEESYNTMMASIGLSELKYYNEYGDSLFVCEAGALSSAIDKVITFLKKVKDTIVSIFNKFVAFMRDNAASNKMFVKTHKSKLENINTYIVKDESKMYSYSGLDNAISDLDNADFYNDVAGDLSNIDSRSQYSGGVRSKEDIEKRVAEARGSIAGVNGSLSEEEMVNEITNRCKGNKISGSYSVSKQLEYITNMSNDIKKAKKSCNEITKKIDEQINKLRKLPRYVKAKAGDDKTEKDDDTKKAENDNINSVGFTITALKNISSAVTAAYGVIITSLRGRSATARKICTMAIKAESKNEAAYYYEYADESVDDLFDSVSIY
jgi:hypothetical protein